MSGNWTSLRGQTIQSGTWNALINNPNILTATVAGNWNVFVTTTGIAGEVGPSLATFTQSGNSITVTLQGETITATGTVSNLNLIFSWVGADGVTTNIFIGTADATATNITGTWSATNGQSGTWRATKVG